MTSEIVKATAMSKQNCRIGRVYSRTISPTPFGEKTSMRLEIIKIKQTINNSALGGPCKTQ